MSNLLEQVFKTLLYELNNSLSEFRLDAEAYTAVHLLNLWPKISPILKVQNLHFPKYFVEFVLNLKKLNWETVTFTILLCRIYPKIARNDAYIFQIPSPRTQYQPEISL